MLQLQKEKELCVLFTHSNMITLSGLCAMKPQNTAIKSMILDKKNASTKLALSY